jgi:hypothetical protein
MNQMKQMNESETQTNNPIGTTMKRDRSYHEKEDRQDEDVEGEEEEDAPLLSSSTVKASHQTTTMSKEAMVYQRNKRRIEERQDERPERYEEDDEDEDEDVPLIGESSTPPPPPARHHHQSSNNTSMSMGGLRVQGLVSAVIKQIEEKYRLQRSVSGFTDEQSSSSSAPFHARYDGEDKLEEKEDDLSGYHHHQQQQQHSPPQSFFKFVRKDPAPAPSSSHHALQSGKVHVHESSFTISPSSFSDRGHGHNTKNKVDSSFVSSEGEFDSSRSDALFYLSDSQSI